MRRVSVTWIVFACCLVVVIGGLAYVTSLVLGLERAQAEALGHAALEEKIRLALWRMDSAVSPIVAQENARPYFHYSAFYPAERAYGRMLATPAPGEVLIPSPLLTGRVQHVLVHFQVDPQGRFSSPEVPDGAMRRLASRSGLDEASFGVFRQRLLTLRQVLHPQQLAASFPGNPPDQPVPVRVEAPPAAKKVAIALPAPEQQIEEQKGLSDKEYAIRAGQQVLLNREMAQQNIVIPPEKAQQSSPASSAAPQVSPSDTAQPGRVSASEPAVLSSGELRPIWLGDRLFLGRRVWAEKGVYVQGCWVDWPNLSAQLLGLISDLLPEARLQPIRVGDASSPGLALASLPIRLAPGRLAEPAAGSALLRLPLLFVWGHGPLFQPPDYFRTLRGGVAFRHERQALP